MFKIPYYFKNLNTQKYHNNFFFLFCSLSKPLPTKDSSLPTSVTLSKTDSKTETAPLQVANNNSLKVSSKVIDSTNTPNSSLPDLSNVQPAETTLSQADLKSNDTKDSNPALCISSSSNSSDEERESK